MPPNRRNMNRDGRSPDDSTNQSRSAMQSIEFPTWLERVKTRLAEVEVQYDLKMGEMMQASNTSTNDLVELHSYGWTAAETTACIVDRAGLR